MNQPENQNAPCFSSENLVKVKNSDITTDVQNTKLIDSKEINYANKKVSTFNVRKTEIKKTCLYTNPTV